LTITERFHAVNGKQVKRGEEKGKREIAGQGSCPQGHTYSSLPCFGLMAAKAWVRYRPFQRHLAVGTVMKSPFMLDDWDLR
jgi:hypothetical protein